MKFRESIKFRIICNAIAIICFGIVSYGNFHKGETTSGILFGVLTLADILVMIKLLNEKNH